jgi:molybdopterin-guanine dinucleotide biosynthesis protein B
MKNKKSQRIVAVCGVKNSGKTTLLERLVEKFSKEGVKVAVIKHDGHDFTCDIEGTDSSRIKAAGAYGTAVFSEHRSFIHKTGTKETLESLIGQFPEADLIFLEGMKETDYPKIELIREGISTEPVSNPKGRLLLVTNRSFADYGEETAGFDELEKIARIIMGDYNEKNQNGSFGGCKKAL